VYLYSTRDEPVGRGLSQSSIVPPNAIRRKLEGSSEKLATTKETDSYLRNENGCDSPLITVMDDTSNSDDSDNGQHDRDIDFDVTTGELDEADYRAKVSVVLPRRRFSGARNVDTIKDGVQV
jgi:hypothetical protein